jgi:hypothetical protein
LLSLLQWVWWLYNDDDDAIALHMHMLNDLLIINNKLQSHRKKLHNLYRPPRDRFER